MNPLLVRHVVLPAWQRLRRQNSLQVLVDLERTQWLPAEEVEALRWRRLGTLLRHAYVNVPYYREVMRDVGVDPDSAWRGRSLAMLPLLDRSTVHEQRERLRAVNVPSARFIQNGTGGSTGTPLRFFDDRD